MFKTSQKQTLISRTVLSIYILALFYILLSFRVWLNYKETVKLTAENKALKQQLIRGGESLALGQSSNIYSKQLYNNSISQNISHYQTLQELNITIAQITTQNQEGQIIGQISNIEVGKLEGWACLRGCLNESLEVYIFIDNRLVDIVNTSWNAPSLAIKDICMTEKYGSFIDEPKKSLDKKQRVGFKFILPDLIEQEHQVRVVAMNKNSRSGVELINSPTSYAESLSANSFKMVNDRKDRLLVTRNQQILDLYEQLLDKNDYRKALNHPAERNTSERLEQHQAFIGVYTTSKQYRDALRQTWFPTKEYLRILEVKYKIVFRFLSLKGSALNEKELEEYEDIIRINLPQDSKGNVIAKAYFSQIQQFYNAKYYYKMDQSVILDIPQFIKMIRDSTKHGSYMGCFKSGEIYSESNNQWYEEEHWRFGDKVKEQCPKQYIKHAHSNFYGFSSDVVQYIAQNIQMFHIYTHEDVQMGAWVLGLNISYDQSKYCCTYEDCFQTPNNCIAIIDREKNNNFFKTYNQCIVDNVQTSQAISSIVKESENSKDI